MSLFHAHAWEVTGSDYMKPAESFSKISLEGSGTALPLLDYANACRRGETHIYLKCATCGDIDSRTVPGKWPGEPKR